MRELESTLMDLAALLRQAKTIAAPFDAQIQALEIAKADALSALLFQIESLKAIVRPMVLAQRRSVKVDGLTASFTERHTWDSDTLLAMAQEIPTLMQCQRDTSYVSFR